MELPPQNCQRGCAWKTQVRWPHLFPVCSPQSECSCHCWRGLACQGRDIRASPIHRLNLRWAACICIWSRLISCRCKARWCSVRDCRPRQTENTSGAAAQHYSGRLFWLELRGDREFWVCEVAEHRHKWVSKEKMSSKLSMVSWWFDLMYF